MRRTDSSLTFSHSLQHTFGEEPGHSHKLHSYSVLVLRRPRSGETSFLTQLSLPDRAFYQVSSSESGLLLFLNYLKPTSLTRACNTSPSTLEGILVA